MTTTVRYQAIDNTLGVAFTIENYPSTSDGDDRPYKIVKRFLRAADIGNGAGQTGHAAGAIVCAIPPVSNVLFVEGSVYRPKAAVGGAKPYQNLDGVVYTPAVPVAQSLFQFILNLDNSVRIIDPAYGAAGALVAGDVVIVKLIMGQPEISTDSMN